MSPRRTPDSSRRRFGSKHILLLCLAAVVLVASACGRGDLPQSTMSNLDGKPARDVDRLWDLVFPIAVVIFVLVQGMIIFIAFRFRSRSDDDAPVQVHGNAKAEIAWTIAPALLLAVVGVFTVVTVFDINAKAEGSDVLSVKVIGHQWWWEYQYPDQDIVTANELVIPTGRTVQLEMTSVDVIHSFWPPKLAGKVDVVPGRTNHMTVEADTPGDYSGQCAEYCGLSHANMRLRVIAKDAADFDDWVANQQRDSVKAPATTTTTAKPPADAAGGAAASDAGATKSLLKAGKAPVGEDPQIDAAAGSGLFVTKGCSGCHAIKGLEGANGKVGPNLTHLQSRSSFAGAVFDLNEPNLRRWLRDPPAMKPMNPTNGQGMPNLGLSEDEITQLIAYLETLK